MEIPYDLKKELDFSFLRSIINGLNTGTYKLETARSLAREFISVVDAKDETLIKNFVTVFVANHPEFKDLQIIVQKYDDDAATRTILEKMRSHMKQGDLDTAIAVASEHTDTKK